MKYAIINPIDNSVHSIEDVMSASDIHLNIGAPYIVPALEDTQVGAIYDPHSATFDNPDPPVEPPPEEGGARSRKGGRHGDHERG